MSRADEFRIVRNGQDVKFPVTKALMLATMGMVFGSIIGKWTVVYVIGFWFFCYMLGTTIYLMQKKK